MRVHDAPGPLDHGKGGWCPNCHLAWTEGQAAHCAGCCRHFSSDSAFDLHHTLDEEGRTVCHDPATLYRRGSGKPKLVQRDGVWGWPGEYNPRDPQGRSDAMGATQDARRTPDPHWESQEAPNGPLTADATALSGTQQTLGDAS